jgi:arylsulfatase
MLVKLPSASQESSTDAFTRVADVPATILDYAQIQHPGSTYEGRSIHPIEGRSLKPILDEQIEKIYDQNQPIATELFGNSAVYKGDWKALYLAPPVGDGTWKLYDLTQDIGEQNDLSAEHPDKLAELLDDYEQYANRVNVIPPLGFDLSKFSDVG